MVNTKRTTLSATALVLVSGVVLAFGTTALASNLQETVAVSLQEVDTDQNGCLSEEEYNEAMKKSRQQWENQYGFTEETPSSQPQEAVSIPFQEADTDQNGCLSEEEYNEATKKSRQQWENQYGFTKETPSSQVEDVAPPGTAAPMKAPKAHPQEFEKEMPSSQE